MISAEELRNLEMKTSKLEFNIMTKILKYIIDSVSRMETNALIDITHEPNYFITKSIYEKFYNEGFELSIVTCDTMMNTTRKFLCINWSGSARKNIVAYVLRKLICKQVYKVDTLVMNFNFNFDQSVIDFSSNR